MDDERGLTAAEVTARVADGRTNELPDAQTRTTGAIIRANVLTRFNALLGAMFVLILATGHLRDGLFGLVLVANALIGIVQEVRAKRTLDRLTLLSAPKARVLRDGAESELPVEQVVQDDLLLVSPGSQVVVDGVVAASEGLELDESLLSGESDAVLKAAGDQVLSGSFVAAGTGKVRATKVGELAYAAQLASEAKRFSLTSSELRSSIDRILTWVTWAIVPTAVLLFVSQLRHHADWRAAVTGAVAGTVAMVPEGLVLLTSVAFAMSVLRLSRSRVLVQELPAVEGLARVDVLCIDKTGTLTEGKLTVKSIEPLDPQADLTDLLAAFAAADPAPNPTMRAIALHAGEPASSPAVAATVPFSSARKWSAVAFADGRAVVLGGADVIPGLDGAARDIAERRTEGGDRILVLAETSGGLPDVEAPLPPMNPLALIALGDAIRSDAGETLAYFARQNVRVMVLSGDDPRTVGAIAAALELPGSTNPVDARELPDQPSALTAALEQTNVFGRVTPHRKRDMVQALQAAGHTVAMTGDGVNDALALKHADIGIAMGSGSDATRAVAQLVLLDSRFATLPSVVAEGRRVLANIERTSGLYLTKTVYAMLISLAVGVAGFVFPFLPRHLTLVGAVTIGIPSFFLALAPNERRFHSGFLRRVVRFAVPTGTLAALATFLAYALANAEPGVSLSGARTTAVMVLTWVGLLVLSIVATPLKGWRLGLVGAMTGLFLVVMVLPPTQDFFSLQVPKLIVWLAGMGIAAIVWSFARLFVPAARPVGDEPDRGTRGRG
ncbi:MAG: cation-transporting P-type ATPase [Actinomycetota bacterium]|jgi:cation-transporting ATPase E|nr:cation-transporting P-type ATPase [Actinomycetota bacterium]